MKASLLKKSFFAFALISLVVGSLAISGSPTIIAVLDSPVDYSHPEIQAVLDEGLLKAAKLVDESGQEKSWYDLNLEAKAEFEKRLNKKLYAEQVHYIDSINEIMGGKLPSDKAFDVLTAVVKGTVKYVFSPKYRSSLNVVSAYLHGTHVAGIAVKSLSNARLITFPIASSQPKNLTLSEILKFDPVRNREQLRKKLEQISEVLQSNNVRVVNLSFSSSEQTTFKSMKQRATILQKTIFRGKLREMAKESSKIYIEELDTFIRSNPNAVFVLAAGNQKLDLSKGSDHSAKIHAENLIKVGAIDGKGKIAPFSNRSSSFVDIVAIGTGVASALVGGGKMHMSGTSQAAPNVANALAQIFESAPQLSAKEAVETLYDQRSSSDDSLSSLVANGRVLLAGDAKGKTNNQTQVPKVKAEFGNISGLDFSILIAQHAQQMVSQNLSALDIVITKDGVEGATVRLTNSQGQINVEINEISTTSDNKPIIAEDVRTASGAVVSCKDLLIDL